MSTTTLLKHHLRPNQLRALPLSWLRMIRRTVKSPAGRRQICQNLSASLMQGYYPIACGQPQPTKHHDTKH